MIRTAEEGDVDFSLLKAVEAANEQQKRILFEKLHRHIHDLLFADRIETALATETH